jgi:sarcosine oxidase subunit alpha
LVDYVTLEAYTAGESAAKYVMGEASEAAARVPVIPQNGVRYAVPQFIGLNGAEGAEIKFRSDGIYRNASVKASFDGEIVYTKRKRIVTPGEMETVKLPEIRDCKEVRIWLET